MTPLILLALFVVHADAGDLASQVETLPNVAAVESNRPCTSTRTIIHVLNWHYVTKARFTADLRDAASEHLSDETIDERYAAFLDDVKAIQDEQVTLLESMMKRLKVRHIHIEGLSEKNLPAFLRHVEALRTFSKNLPTGDTPIEQLLLAEYRDDLLQIGSAGKLMMADKADVLPAEEAAIFEAADPISNGTFRLDRKRTEKREDAIVKRLLQDRSRVALLVLGGAHDLSGNVPPDCWYIRVRTTKFPVEDAPTD